MAHEVFDELKVKAWIASKIEVDAMPGCRARAIVVEQRLAGWCAIQFEDEKYEIAIVMGDEYWGLGKGVFRDMMAWAKALGYKSIFIHLLDTRPEYKFLRKMAKNVVESELSVE